MRETGADCCSTPPSTSASTDKCPSSADSGRSVSWKTVAALFRGPVPPPQDFWICPDPDCPVVYFGSEGAVITGDEVTVIPSFKTSGDDMICYCFLHRRRDVAAEILSNGKTQVVQSIREKIQASACVCEIRNPTGRCCLGEVSKVVTELLAE